MPSITKIFHRRSNRTNCSEKAQDSLRNTNNENNVSGNTIIDDESVPMSLTSREHARIEVMRSPRVRASPQKTALLATAKKYKEGDEALDAGDYETAKQLFNQALRARLMIFGADSDLVSRCHYKLMKIAYLEGDDEKFNYHESAVVRASDARDMEKILKTCSKLLAARKN